ncbi:MAG: molybdopterin molybdotransferase MoeA [Candidatus Nezhaarchaeales archaeon]
MKRLHRVSEVLREALKNLSPPNEVEVPVEDSLGKYSAETVLSSFKLPPGPKAVMDGYAVRACDVEAASPTSPVPLRLLSPLIRPGLGYHASLEPGSAVRIETGALLPPGADAVAPLEDAVEEEGRVLVLRRLAKYENVSLPGEEYDEGLVIVRRGCMITPQAIAGLIVEGRARIRTFDLRARILNVGDEFIGGTHFRPFTHAFVAAWLKWHGIAVDEVSMAGDAVDEVLRWLQRSPATYLNVLIGGTSVGGHDYTVRAVEEARPEFFVHGLAIQPGKTACLAIKNGAPIVALSGLPVAAMSTLEYLLKPLLRGLGLDVPNYPKVRAVLLRRVTVKPGLRGFVRVKVYEDRGTLYAEPIMAGGSGALASLLKGNGFIEVPEDLEGFDEGCEVEVNLYGPVPALG